MGIFPPGTYDLFLTHGWRYTDEWQGLVALLDDYLPGKWRNWSLPHLPGSTNIRRTTIPLRASPHVARSRPAQTLFRL